MADKVDSITLEIEATTQKADKGIDKTIESLKAMKTALNGINTKKLRQETDLVQLIRRTLSRLRKSGTSSQISHR